jgi:RNA polymerase sigma-70 factor (ECF subfamily)
MTLAAREIGDLYRSHGHIVLRRARTLLGSEADAHEAVQEVFAQLLRAPHALHAARSAVAWLYQATTHFCLNLLRNRRTSARLLERQAAAAPPSGACAPRADALAEVRSLLSLLPEPVAAAVVYHHLDGMSHAEVAELLGCSRRQVGYLLERAQGVLSRAEQSV